MINIPESLFPIVATSPVTTNGGVTCDYVSMKNIHTLYAVVTLTQAVGHATLLTPTQATAVAGTSAKVMANVLPIWADEDVATSDTLVRQTDALNHTVSADIKNKIVVFRIDAEKLDGANSFDCVTIVAADSSQATNFINVNYFAVPRYGTAPPSFITD